jgi:hypothetical protein
MEYIVGLVMLAFSIYKIEPLWAIAGAILLLAGEFDTYNIRAKKFYETVAKFLLTMAGINLDDEENKDDD